MSARLKTQERLSFPYVCAANRAFVSKHCLVFALTLLAVIGEAQENTLPIIPGAAGFGMETPAGSGRHLQDVSLSLIHI